MGQWKRIGTDISLNHMYEKPILERAFELARSGEYPRVKELEKALSKEGYSKGDPHIHSPSVRKQLRFLCSSACGIEHV